MVFYESNLFVGVLVFVLTSIVTFLITSHFTKKNFRTKILECVLLEKYSPVTFSSDILENIKITYDGVEANSIQVFKYRIENCGLEAIKSQPIKINFAKNSIIKKCCITHFPAELFGKIEYEAIGEDQLFISIELLNPQDYILVEVVTINGENDSVEIFAKNENVIFRKYDYKKEKEDTINLMSEISVKFDSPLLLLPYLPKILKTYPSLFRLMKIDNKIKKNNDK